MGSSPGIIKGFSEIFKMKHDTTPLVAVIGDGTFYHSGIQAILNLLHSQSSESNITIIILNNGSTALTGWQPNPGTGNYANCNSCNLCKDDSSEIYTSICNDVCLKPKCMLKSFGFKDIVEIDQFEFDKLENVINSAISRKGIKFIIPIRPCVVAFKVQKPTFIVDENKCIGCKRCVELACQALIMKEYKNQTIKKAFIDSVLCTGCSLCAQVCPLNAIKQCE